MTSRLLLLSLGVLLSCTSSTLRRGASDGTPCDDGDPCTLADVVRDGVCTGGAPVVCASSGACEAEGACDPSTGACRWPAAPDETPCDDGDACTLTDRCLGGSCAGGDRMSCDAPGVCHVEGGCDPTTGACSYPPAPDLAPCDGGDACTVRDFCLAGTCTPGETRSCEPPGPCHTEGACDPASGTCSHPAAADGTPCDDASACTESDTCTAGACTPGAPVVCAAGTRQAPAVSCKAVLESGASAGDGTYWLADPGGGFYLAYCDMTTDGGGWTRVRRLSIPADLGAGWTSADQVPYVVEPVPRHDRVLVRLVLDDHSAWVSWKDGPLSPYPTFGSPIQGELPEGRAGSDSTAGRPVRLRIQNWSQCYRANWATGRFGWGDLPYVDAPCFGTFAFFDGATTLFAFGGWARGGPADLGIGPGPDALDWTGASNGAAFGVRRVEWYVGSPGAGPDACHGPAVCEPTSGACPFPALPDGSPCDDGDPCTERDVCQGGACAGSGDSCRRLDHVLISGQSLSTGALSEIVSAVQPYANRSFSTGVRAGGGSSTLVPLVETWDGGQGETIASGMANLSAALVLDDGGKPVPLLISDNGVGGTSYGGLKKGTAAYADGLAQISAARSIAVAGGQTHRVTAMFVVHGESDHIIGHDIYEDMLVEWQHDVETDAQAITGQAEPVPLFLCQMSSFTFWSATSLIPAAQLAAAVHHPDRIYLVAPKYFLPYADGVHLTGDGERWLGEFYAKAYKRVMYDGKPWVPLSPRSVSRSGALITVDFNVPAPPLVLDTHAVTDPGHMGFEYTDDSGAPPKITSVSLNGPTKVVVRLAQAPTGSNRRIRYAFTGIYGRSAGPTTGARGNLRDSDVTRSLGGHPLANWAVHFDEAVP